MSVDAEWVADDRATLVRWVASLDEPSVTPSRDLGPYEAREPTSIIEA